ncbi:GNAT family N-acetyltransferase [Coralloluteibacterium thermophilus]|uniref:GNAT family N-acetyltransferase n=1 Tax=Coralloluteibacterium thermophilum TaxID=2707049 RepID=A0ABV9NIV9_9GAMM
MDEILYARMFRQAELHPGGNRCTFPLNSAVNQMEPASAVEIVSLSEVPAMLDVVAEWYYGAWGREDGLTLEVEQQTLRASLVGTGLPRTYLAFAHGSAIGAVQLKLGEMPQLPGYVHWLGAVYVAPSARGRGVAQSLVHHAVEQARAQGIQRLYLQTEDLTGGLYARCGWAAVSFAESHGKRVLVMERRLDVNGSFGSNPLRDSVQFGVQCL